MFAIIAAVLLSLVLLMAILLVFGLPLGEFTMGGQTQVLPAKLRLATLGCFITQVFFICMILQAGGFMPMWFSVKATKYVCIAIAIYLSCNTVMNFLSKSKKEKYFMTPLSLGIAICTFITAAKMT